MQKRMIAGNPDNIIKKLILFTREKSLKLLRGHDIYESRKDFDFFKGEKGNE
jgi:hypothetical protein